MIMIDYVGGTGGSYVYTCVYAVENQTYSCWWKQKYENCVLITSYYYI